MPTASIWLFYECSDLAPDFGRYHVHLELFALFIHTSQVSYSSNSHLRKAALKATSPSCVQIIRYLRTAQFMKLVFRPSRLPILTMHKKPIISRYKSSPNIHQNLLLLRTGGTFGGESFTMDLGQLYSPWDRGCGSWLALLQAFMFYNYTQGLLFLHTIWYENNGYVDGMARINEWKHVTSLFANSIWYPLMPDSSTQEIKSAKIIYSTFSL